MMLQRRALFDGKSGWDDPDYFSPTSIWIDLRDKEVPYTIEIGPCVLKSGSVELDWGDGTIDTTSLKTTGLKSLSHTYTEAKQYKMVLDGAMASYSLGETDSWTGFFKQSSNGTIIQLVRRLRIGYSGVITYASFERRCFDIDSIKVSANEGSPRRVVISWGNSGFRILNWARFITRIDSFGLYGNSIYLHKIYYPSGNVPSQTFDGSNGQIRYIEAYGIDSYVTRQSKTIQSMVIYNSINWDGSFYQVNTLKYLILTKTSGIINGRSDQYLTTDSFVSGGAIYVPTSLVDTYKTAVGWTKCADRFVGVDDFTQVIKDAKEYADATDDSWVVPEWPD